MLVVCSYFKKSGTYPPEMYTYLTTVTLIDENGLLGGVISKISRIITTRTVNFSLSNITKNFPKPRPGQNLFICTAYSGPNFLYQSGSSSGSSIFRGKMGT